MLTIFSTPKAFTGHFGVIQRNAIRSWAMLEPRPEIILFGSDEGTAEICAELGLRHVPDVETSGRVPLISDMFSQAQRLARNDTLTFLNADIVLLPGFLETVRRARQAGGPFLAIGQRTDLTQPDLVDFDQPGWAETLAERCSAEGELMPPNWIDHFTFPRGLYTEVPRFAIGRSGYDNWLLWKAEETGARLIDVTRHCPVVHQRHDYSHSSGAAAVFGGADAQRARVLVGHWSRYYGVAHARWLMNAEGAIVPARELRYRLARPRRALAHTLRFTVPLRRRIIDLRLSRKLRSA
jgi:hypothetical protein